LKAYKKIKCKNKYKIWALIIDNSLMNNFRLFSNNKSSFWCNISKHLLIKLSTFFIGHLVEMMLKFVANLINGKVKKWKELTYPLIIPEQLEWVSVRLDRALLIIFWNNWMVRDMNINLKLMGFGNVRRINNLLEIIEIMKTTLWILQMLNLFCKFFKNN
jgi:hypothetical protein